MEAVVIERSIVVTADRERVWRAITTPEHIAQWFEPIRFERLAVGEALTFGWDGEGSIALVEPMDRFGFRWQIAPPHPAQTLVVFALETVPEGTRIIVTEQGFEALNMEEMRAAMRRPVLIDGRNIYDPDEMSHLGFNYRGIGRDSGPAQSVLLAGETQSTCDVTNLLQQPEESSEHRLLPASLGESRH